MYYSVNVDISIQGKLNSIKLFDSLNTFNYLSLIASTKIIPYPEWFARALLMVVVVLVGVIGLLGHVNIYCTWP